MSTKLPWAFGMQQGRRRRAIRAECRGHHSQCNVTAPIEGTCASERITLGGEKEGKGVSARPRIAGSLASTAYR